MIVTCERCATQFQLDDARVPARGVRVRCSRCKYAFRVVPAAQRAAEEATALARRAREGSEEEITQDMPEDSAGDSLSRAGVRRERRAEAAPPAEEEGGLLDEESDWKFNEDVSGGRDPRGSTGSGREHKPDPPEATPPPKSGGRLADDWFHGGSDAPLELDERPRPGSVAPEPAKPAAPEPPPAPPLARASAPEPTPAPAPIRAPAPAPQPVAEAEEPAPGDSFEAGLAGLEASGEISHEPAQPSGLDELSSDSLDLLAAAEEAEAEQAVAASETAEPPATASRPSGRSLGGDLVVRVLRWLGYGAHGIGWSAACALLAGGLYLGLAPTAQPALARERVGVLELAALQGRFVENARAGSLYVVSGRVRNPGAEVASLRPLELELVDAEGVPLGGERVAAHAPSPTSLLREASAEELAGLPPLSGTIRPGEERSFELLLPALPAQAASFRVVEREGRGRAGAPLPGAEPLPAVQLPSTH